MRLAVLTLLAALFANAAAHSPQGLYNLLRRRLPSHCEDFVFTLHDAAPADPSELINDEYTVSTTSNGTVTIQGNSVVALATGLRRYLTDIANVDIYWFARSRLGHIASPLPTVSGTITGKSVVPWRYFFNTVTFSYTTPFWSFSDWELELDWLALHGVNLPLAWVGFEKILLDVFRGANLTDSEIIPFFSGPAFQAWNRFGNIQGSWGGELPLQWIESQFALQKQILERMLELGMTPVLPAFTGFVPRALPKRHPNVNVVNGSQWEDFSGEFTKTTFLEPADPLFAQLQELTIAKQIEYYGNITQFYTLDQYNENDPFSGDLDYLRNVTYGTWKSLKTANPAAVWVMQGWLFYSNRDFWNTSRIEAYLSGVEEDSDMLVLDLFSESEPQWQRTNSYYGKPWIWNQLHNYGGNMGLYGQVDNVTINPIEALARSDSLIGFGLTMEGQEGNEIMYKLLLDQAWQPTPINTSSYFDSFVRCRYSNSNNSIPSPLYTAWHLLRTSAYNNTNLTAHGNAVPKSIFELAPNITGLTNRTGHHPTTIPYDPVAVTQAYTHFLAAAAEDEALWTNPAFQHDLVDIARQVLSNAFTAEYISFISSWSSPSLPKADLSAHASTMLSLLSSLDALLTTLPQFNLAPWIEAARAQANYTSPATATNTSETNKHADADFFEYTARNQISIWGPRGEINDYASKSWGGLVGAYYRARWEVFLGYLVGTGPGGYEDAVARGLVEAVEERFQVVGSGMGVQRSEKSVREVVEGVLEEVGML